MARFRNPVAEAFHNRLVAGGFEPLQNYPLYSVQSLSAAALPAETTFFGDAVGQNSKTLKETNMGTGGQLPDTERFLITSINIAITDPAANTAVEDADVGKLHDTIRLIGNGGVFQLNMNGNEVLTVRCGAIPQGNGQAGVVAQTYVAATTVATGFATSGVPHVGNAFPFLYPIEKVNFNAKILAPGTAPTLTLAVAVEVRLNGIRYRTKLR